MHRSALAAFSILITLLGVGAAYAQRGGGDWITGGYDAQRSSWVRSDAKISPESMAKPGFALEWKVDLKEAGRPQVLLTPPVLFDFYISYRGFRSLAFVGSTANALTAIDTDLARIEWKKTFDASPSTQSTALCPGGMTSGVARPTVLGYPPPTSGRGSGRANPARSGVGEPMEGAVTLEREPTRSVPPAPAKPTSSRRVAAPPNPYAPRVQYVYTLTADGKLHSVFVSNGEEPKSAVPFLPPNAYAQGLIVIDQVAYVATSNGCGGVENGLWALDLASQKVSHWNPGAGGVAGSLGPAVGPDGTLYVASGGELFALEEGTLKPKGSHSISKREFTSTPVVFDFKGKDLIAATSNDGRLHLFDAASLKSPLATSAAFSSEGFVAGALASWEDPDGVRWVLAPAGGATAASAGFPTTNGAVKSGAIVAWKVVEHNGAPALEPGWVSRDMVSPLTPMIVNGVIFAVSAGDSAQRSSRAVLYALDAATGKQLWSSGNTMTTTVRRGGLAAGGSRVYVATQDGVQYTFGFPIEH